ncbi:Protein-tyrosine phosphatase [Ancylostoma ceylanicum]|uniref:protein-tyrosine-phosphatase n=2 Tax=Ancylostoma ceylanicum TaxID=53326 RepID=A0A0D6M9F8_9BILA|nr:Protein-tyrosine phosphatase [Ancylostoma ceylanicum]
MFTSSLYQVNHKTKDEKANWCEKIGIRGSEGNPEHFRVMDPKNEQKEDSSVDLINFDVDLQQPQSQESVEQTVPVDPVPLSPVEKIPEVPTVDESSKEINNETPKASNVDQLLEDFLNYEANLSMTDYIKRFYQIRLEQEALRSDAEFSSKCASENVHVVRNRYRDILPYDRNRVVLSQTDENPNGYINASFISLPKGRTHFIAAQAPLTSTLEEWWKMVDEQKVVLIVMLCKLVELSKVKCERYWPSEIGQSLIFGCYEITLESEESFADDDYLLRRLKMSNQKTGESRSINQLHYREWPDHGCPSGEGQLINMIEKMPEYKGDSDAPVLVHCSAGVGRTGTIISVNYIRELIESKELDSLDLFELVMSLRKQRASMVQTQDQYHFVHKCVAHYCRERLGIPHPQPREDSPMETLPAVPTRDAPVFTASQPENGGPSLQGDVDEESDEDFEGNDIPDFPHEPPAPRGPEELGSAAS